MLAEQPATVSLFSGFLPIAALIISLIAGLASPFVTWWKDANRDARRLRLWDETKKAIDVWDARLKLIQAAAANDDKALQLARLETLSEMESIRAWLGAELEASRTARAQALQKPPKTSGLRYLLLLYPDAKEERFATFRRFRLVYWGTLVLSSIVIFGEIAFVIHNPSRTPSPLLLSWPVNSVLSWAYSKDRYKRAQLESPRMSSETSSNVAP